MLYAVIMAGGSGTRFWPLSRERRPKQTLPLTSNKSLLRETIERILPVVKKDNILIVTVRSQRRRITSLLPDIPPENIIVEPYARNTAAAIGLAALHVKRRLKGGIMVVLPADHTISDSKAFQGVIRYGRDIVKHEDRLLTLGLKPHYPETGYGYIEAGKKIKQKQKVETHKHSTRTIERFIEKPSLSKAKELLKSSNYYWNGGIFIWKAETILGEIDTYMPELSSGLARIDKSLDNKSSSRTLSKIYKSFSKVSIDNGIMEKTSLGGVIPCNIGWNDLGSWLALSELVKMDENGNCIIGNDIAIASEGCLVHNSRGLTALVGVKDLIVVTTRDATLVCSKKNSQDVKKVVELLKARGLDKYL
ncbi:MAG: NTP transferase domain-containing protein [Nitrospinae bacterium]|nr:NTP transferase domain-containing protein [Nitrospinota bacterium]